MTARNVIKIKDNFPVKYINWVNKEREIMEMHKKGELVLEDIKEEDGDVEGDMFQGITLKELDRDREEKEQTSIQPKEQYYENTTDNIEENTREKPGNEI